jgi:uncharacterized coiled-coil DUF342 family protein
MGLGSTAKKLQTVAEKAEQVYNRLNKLRDEVEETQDTVDRIESDVTGVQDELREQRAVLYALAEEQEIDADAVAAETHISEAEAAPADDGTGSDEADEADTA